MDLIDVDVIGAQPAQRILDLTHDPGAAGVAEYVSILPFESDLGGDEHARTQAPFGEGLADDLLGAPETVGRSRVDDVDAMLDRGADGGDGFRLVGSAPHPAADRPGAERDPRDLERCAGNSGPFELHLENIGLLNHRATPIDRALRLRGCALAAQAASASHISRRPACRLCALAAPDPFLRRSDGPPVCRDAANARGSFAPHFPHQRRARESYAPLRGHKRS